MPTLVLYFWRFWSKPCMRFVPLSGWWAVFPLKTPNANGFPSRHAANTWLPTKHEHPGCAVPGSFVCCCLQFLCQCQTSSLSLERSQVTNWPPLNRLKFRGNAKMNRPRFASLCVVSFRLSGSLRTTEGGSGVWRNLANKAWVARTDLQHIVKISLLGGKRPVCQQNAG